eukprot:m51a1_g10721 hypothetical protein (556) ;mRNA; f:228436-230274
MAHDCTRALETALLLRQHVLPRLGVSALRSLALAGRALPLLAPGALSLAVALLPPFRARALLLDLVASPCRSSCPVSRASAASLFHVERRAGGPVDIVGDEADDESAADVDKEYSQYWQDEGGQWHDSDLEDDDDFPVGDECGQWHANDGDHDDHDDHDDQAQVGYHPPCPGDVPQQQPWPDVEDRPEDVLEPVRRTRADPPSALAVALRCCRAAAALSSCGGGGGDDDLVRALDDAASALAPGAACPSDLEDCAPLVCALGSPEALLCLADALGPVRAAAAAHGKFLACIACASGGAAGMLRVLGREPFCLGHDDAMRGRLTCRTWDFVPGKSHVGPKAFAYRPCDIRDYGYQPVYTLCAACANDDAEALAVLSEPPYSLTTEDALTYGGDHDGNNDSIQCVLEMACISGSASAVRALGLPPYSLTGDRESSLMGLQRACEAGSTSVLDALAEPPWNLVQGDALCVLRSVLIWFTAGTASALRRLQDPPYCVTWEDVVLANDGKYDAELVKLFGSKVQPDDKEFADALESTDGWQRDRYSHFLECLTAKSMGPQ